jgi:hypothetical protein
MMTTMRCAMKNRFAWLALIAILIAGSPAESAQSTRSARFAVIDVVIEATAPLAAWQADVVAIGDGQVVGVEGGEAPLDQPPYYDPAALQKGRIVLGAFTTRGGLAAGRHRVATLHLREAGPPVVYEVTLQAAADPSGARITARITLVPRREQP